MHIKWRILYHLYRKTALKYSIKNIFKNITTSLIFITLLAGASVFMSIDYYNSHAKVDNLLNQKKMIDSINNLPIDDIELSLIKLSGQGGQLQDDAKKLRNSYEFDFTEKYILMNSAAYLADLDKLDSLIITFNKNANDYYSIGATDKKESGARKAKLQISTNSLLGQIDLIVSRALSYNKSKLDIHKNVSYAEFAIIIFITFWYRKRLKLIYRDLQYLNGNQQKGYIISTEEVDSITMKMKRKPSSTENPDMIDLVTGINNTKGLMSSYAEKKGMKDDNYTSVTVFEVDNFLADRKKQPQEFINGTLKKIAFSLSLHEQATDVMARTDQNQFTIILSRQNKEESFKEMDIIRQNISELNFNGEIKITISGGYIIKPNNTTLEEAIRQAKNIMYYAQKVGGNRISQIKDVAQSEL